MELNVSLFKESDTVDWDIFCANSLQGTLLHTRKFLSYHNDRYKDQSLIISSGEKWLGVLPAALNPNKLSQVVSHPGSTYGGVIHQGGLRGYLMLEALNSVVKFYSNQGLHSLIYKVTPSFYHRSPAEDDLYALFRIGALKIRCDLSSTINLNNRLQLTKGRRWGIKKAQKSKIVIVEGLKYLEQLWKILSDNLSEKHKTAPVHSLREMEILMEKFPAEILCICSEVDGDVVAGVILFVTPQTLHTQYIASNTKGRDICGADAVLEHCIAMGLDAGKLWFDFGISNENNGLILNDSLYSYKNGFGGGGFTHDFYELVF